jgi:hypothetical protein
MAYPSARKTKLLVRHKILLVCFTLLALAWLVSLVQRITPKAAPAPAASYTPPIDYYIAHAQEHTRIGDVMTATLDVRCGSTNDMLVEEIRKSERTGHPRLIGSTQLGFLNVGDRFKVLELRVQQTKIRILSTGNECWIPSLEVR